MPYPSDLTDTQWVIIESLLPRTKDRGTPRKHSIREIMNAIFFICKTGCPWRYLPKDYPPWSTVYKYFLYLNNKNYFEQMNSALTKTARKAVGRKETPSLVCIDSQSVKGDVNLREKGIDGNKKVIGRKRHIVTDVLGLILFCTITAANVSDIHPGRDFLEKIQAIKTIEKVLVDKGYPGLQSKNSKPIVEITSKNSEIEGFVPVFKRWVVERTFAWLNRQRRLAKDYEVNPVHHEAMVYIAMSKIILNRIG